MYNTDEIKTNHTIKNIVKEILKDFAKLQNVVVDESLITFYVQLLMYSPHWQIEGEMLYARKNIQRLINSVVENFQRDRDPDIVTVKIQHNVLTTFRRRHEIVNTKKSILESKLSPLRISILESDNTDVDYNAIFHKIVIYFVLSSGLGNPTYPDVYKQSKVVLQSILTLKDVKAFTALPYVVRSEELENMVRICTGIRIYNMNCGRSSEGVPNLPVLLFDAIYGLTEYLCYILETIDLKLNTLTDAICCVYAPCIVKQTIMLNLVLPEDETLNEDDVDYNIRLVLVYKQFQEAVRTLLNGVREQKASVVKVQDRFKAVLHHLRQNVISNFYIHVSLVFPHFVEISELWSNFQEAILLLNMIRHVVKELDRLVGSLKYENHLIHYYTMREPYKKVFNTDGLHTSEILENPDPACKIFSKDELVSSEDEKNVYEYEGHCCWMMVSANGFLINGKEDYGIVRYSSRYYIFSCPLALKCFMKNPTYYTDRVLQMARERCGLILYLNLGQDLLEVKGELSIIKTPVGKTKVAYTEQACNTETDTTGFIDRTYHSSIWEYRAIALKLANLTTYKSVSTLTDKTFSKNSTGNQTIRNYTKEKEVMTMSEKYTNTPTPLSFIYGLRNDKEYKKQAHLNLTYWDLKPPCSNKK